MSKQVYGIDTKTVYIVAIVAIDTTKNINNIFVIVYNSELH